MEYQYLEIDISEAQKASYRKELGIPDNCNFIIGSVGRMAPDRKPWLYLPIFSEIANVIGPEVQFILGGDGSELDQMKVRVLEHGLEGRVYFPGIVQDPALAFSVMDLYVTLNRKIDWFSGYRYYSGLPVLGILLSDYSTS